MNKKNTIKSKQKLQREEHINTILTTKKNTSLLLAKYYSRLCGHCTRIDELLGG